MLKLSFILPCYNVERYIADCLNSIYAQDLSEDEYEVICVNDCSTDSTKHIVAEYAAKHTNLTLIDHTENLTAGGARNTGIKAARGEYIWFVDPDDCIKPESVEILFKEASEKQVDILFFNYESSREKEEHLTFDTTYDTLSGQDYALRYFSGRFYEFTIVWRCLFRRTFLEENNLLFPIMRKAQDTAFLWNAMLQAGRVCSINRVGYTYRYNPYSVASKTRQATVLFCERIILATQIDSMLHQAKVIIKDSIRKEMISSIKWCVNGNLKPLSCMPKTELKKYYKEIQNHKDAFEQLRCYMNRKSRILFGTYGGERVWMWKLKILLYGVRE